MIAPSFRVNIVDGIQHVRSVKVPVELHFHGSLGRVRQYAHVSTLVRNVEGVGDPFDEVLHLAPLGVVDFGGDRQNERQVSGYLARYE